TQSKCRMLSLPAEIRTAIWRFAIAGQCVGLYREKRRLTYGLLGHSTMKTPGELIRITPDTVRSEVAQMTDPSSKETWGCQPGLKKTNLTALLKTCRTIYFEAIELLYTGNTFVCLQNETLHEFQRSTQPHRFALIRSLHLHFQFRELQYGREGFPAPWDDDTFLTINWTIRHYMQQLRYLSIFLQGPLMVHIPYKNILNDLKGTQRAVSPEFFVVRFPRPAADPLAQYMNFDHLGPITRMLDDPNLRFHICQPPLQPGQPPHDMADLDTGEDAGWRVGAIFSPKDGGEGYETTSYTIFIPV
ncbi:hypothetical protein K469DRAFT_489428, partial [Zopfia rhizophila CBS 207.26]